MLVLGGILCAAGGLVFGLGVGRMLAAGTIADLEFEVDYLADRLGVERDEVCGED